MTKYFFIGILFLAAAFPSTSHATAYYIDFVSGNDTAAGTATTTAWQSLNRFANNARSAGDIAFVRRGVASTTNVTAVTFTSDGTLNNPITISADYDNLWNDFATSSVTVSPTFGSTYMATSASSTDAFPAKWIYIEGDCGETYNSTVLNTCEFAYEIETASSTGISLYLPYKGSKAGSGKNMRVMPSAPRVGTVTEANQIFTNSGDDYWIIKGIEARSTATTATCAIGFSSGNRGSLLFDVTTQGDGVTDCGIRPNGSLIVKKWRSFGMLAGVSIPVGGNFSDVLIDCNNVASSFGLDGSSSGSLALMRMSDLTIKNCVTDFADSNNLYTEKYLRNFVGTNVFNGITGSAITTYFFEDKFSINGLNAQSSNQVSSNAISTTTISSTDNLRAGGGPKNELIFPPSGTGNTGISTAFFPASYIKLFEYPVYTDTSSKTYTMYFNSTSTAQWTTDPTAAQFWIECEYYNETVGADRFLKKSTGVVDFNGSTDWQSLSVTCQPTQSGILYLRGWYGKPKESGGANWFYMDTTPVVS